MLQRIRKIKNIGRFKSLACPDDDRLKFKQFTSIYAKNGAGKTTLAAVIRSMATMDGSILEPWRSVSVPNADQLAVLELSTGITHFDGSAWQRGTAPQFAIFDREFIESNIYIGRSIGKKQREGLLRLALGRSEVAAARTVDDMANRIRSLNKPMRELEQSLVAISAGYELSLDEFLKLDAPTEAELASARKSVSDATTAREVLKRPLLQSLPIHPASTS